MPSLPKDSNSKLLSSSSLAASPSFGSNLG
jgi:hypothetical protein